MFDKLKQYVTQKKETTESDYDLTYDDVAIPEIHTHKSTPSASTENTEETIHYDDVAIPEVHLPKSKITSGPMDQK